jgi:hypothetical protein
MLTPTRNRSISSLVRASACANDVELLGRRHRSIDQQIVERPAEAHPGRCNRIRARSATVTDMGHSTSRGESAKYSNTVEMQRS